MLFVFLKIQKAKNNLEIVVSPDKHTSSQKALEVLEKVVDENTLLLLSGGTSPDELYKLMVSSKKIKPGAIAMIDERFGVRMHDSSNEMMMPDMGVSFYPILQDGLDLEQTANRYEEKLRELFTKYPKKVAVMGIGVDGHTSGIKPDLEYDHTRWVVGYDDADGAFGKRVTTTFECLEQIDEFLLLAFGESKRHALQKVLSGVDPQVMPSGFYTKIQKPVLLFTDISL